MTIFSVLLFLFLLTTAFFSFLLLFYQAWRSGRAVRASVDLDSESFKHLKGQMVERARGCQRPRNLASSARTTAHPS